MKPVIISTVCVVFLVSVWGFFYYQSGNLLNELSSDISNRLSPLITEECWDSATSEIRAVSDKWKKRKPLLYMLSGHGVIREADISLGRLTAFIQNEQVSDSLAEIGALQELFLSIRQGEAFTLDNIL